MVEAERAPHSTPATPPTLAEEPSNIFIMNHIPILPFTKDMTGPAGYLAAASSMSFQSLTKLRREANQFFRWVWYNKDEGCSPKEMLAAMGPE